MGNHYNVQCNGEVGVVAADMIAELRMRFGVGRTSSSNLAMFKPRLSNQNQIQRALLSYHSLQLVNLLACLK